MTRKEPDKNNIDGFVVRRRDSGPGGLGIDNLKVPDRFLNGPQTINRGNAAAGTVAGAPVLRQSTGIGHQPAARPTGQGLANTRQERRPADDISELLNQLPGEAPKQVSPKKRRFSFRLTKKGVKRFFIGMGILLLLIGGYLGVKLFITSGRVFDGNIFSALLNSGKPLKTDQYGRVNILLFGTSEDDNGHDGGDLSDSIMIASINPKDKSGFLLSVPRDLWVKYGQSCVSGYEGKINAAYMCGKEDADGDKDKGAEKLKSIVSRDFGIEIPYYAQVNYAALRDSVNAVGGITVKIESDDPRGVLDRNFDWKCKYRCYYVKHPNGPADLNGEEALALARARNASGGYGLSGGNFDREQYQQKIIIAIRNKAMSAGVLSNPIKVNGLLDSLGDNVNTNFDAGEVKTLVKLTQEVDSSKLKQLSLVDEDDPLVTTGNAGGQSIVRPIKGLYNFTDIKKFVRSNLGTSGAAAIEEATIDVYNGSGVTGAAGKQADLLEAQGFSTGVVGNVPIGSHTGLKLYDQTEGKMPQTKTKLQQQLGVTAINGSPGGVNSTADFVIIIGTNGAN